MMKSIIQIVRNIFFWGVMFLILVLFGLKIPISAIIGEFFNDSIIIKAFSIYIIASVPLLILDIFFHAKESIRKNKNWKIVGNLPYTPFYSTYVFFHNRLWVPIQILDVRVIFRIKSHMGYDALIRNDIKTIRSRLINASWWWALVFFVCKECATVPGNAYITHFTTLSSSQLLDCRKVIGIIAVISFIVLKILFAIDNVICEKAAKELDATISRKKKKDYANRFIPVGCRACGGPYPDCKSSCSIYDD